MTSITIEAIRAEIQQAQKPLLERIEELERLDEANHGHIWKLSHLVHVLMLAYPESHRQTAIDYLQQQIESFEPGQEQGSRETELMAWLKRVEQLPEPPAET